MDHSNNWSLGLRKTCHNKSQRSSTTTNGKVSIKHGENVTSATGRNNNNNNHLQPFSLTTRCELHFNQRTVYSARSMQILFIFSLIVLECVCNESFAKDTFSSYQEDQLVNGASGSSDGWTGSWTYSRSESSGTDLDATVATIQNTRGVLAGGAHYSRVCRSLAGVINTESEIWISVTIKDLCRVRIANEDLDDTDGDCRYWGKHMKVGMCANKNHDSNNCVAAGLVTNSTPLSSPVYSLRGLVNSAPFKSPMKDSHPDGVNILLKISTNQTVAWFGGSRFNTSFPLARDATCNNYMKIKSGENESEFSGHYMTIDESQEPVSLKERPYFCLLVETAFKETGAFFYDVSTLVTNTNSTIGYDCHDSQSHGSLSPTPSPTSTPNPTPTPENTNSSKIEDNLPNKTNTDTKNQQENGNHDSSSSSSSSPSGQFDPFSGYVFYVAIGAGALFFVIFVILFLQRRRRNKENTNESQKPITYGQFVPNTPPNTVYSAFPPPSNSNSRATSTEMEKNYGMKPKGSGHGPPNAVVYGELPIEEFQEKIAKHVQNTPMSAEEMLYVEKLNSSNGKSAVNLGSRPNPYDKFGVDRKPQ